VCNLSPARLTTIFFFFRFCSQVKSFSKKPFQACELFIFHWAKFTPLKGRPLMLKFLLPLTALAISGCCQLFGICTSASVHTSISPPGQFAQQNGSQGEPLLAAESLPSR
jgi:hypothetical protein